VLLLDEPLAALDAQLRERLRSELDQLLRGLGITAVFVTHDQGEAMALGDRILVMEKGRVAQLASPGKSTSSRPMRLSPGSSATSTPSR
jgi:putative spermidine/putrescine transport system ATP-binding protein